MTYVNVFSSLVSRHQKTVCVGMFVFVGGHFSTNPQAYPGLIGVVAWVNPCQEEGEPRGYILMFEEKEMSASAAQNYCLSHKLHGLFNGKSFLPTTEQWLSVFEHTYIINASLREIGYKELKGWYWSSTPSEGVKGKWWMTYAELNRVSTPHSLSKGSENRKVRCMITF